LAQGASGLSPNLYASHDGLSQKIYFEGLRIAFVKPVFTATAYSSFYSFYKIHRGTQVGQYVTTNLNLLNTSLVDTWGWSDGIWTYLNSANAATDGIILGRNTAVITDVDVDQNGLFFDNGTRKYDVVVLGFTEYVTANEYYAYKHFVLSGGKLVFLDADNFMVEVKYYPISNKVSLVNGHGWAFNGTAAWPSVFDAWRDESAQWIGSVFSLYRTQRYYFNGATPNPGQQIGQALIQAFGSRVFTCYAPHEENAITNPNDTIIALWNVSNLKQHNLTVAAYELNQGNGTIIHTGVFGSDIISTDREMQFFLRKAVFPNSSNDLSTGLTTIGVTVTADESVYGSPDDVMVNGSVTGIGCNPHGSVAVRIYYQNGTSFTSAYAPLEKDGSYTVNFSGSMWTGHPGTYTVVATYNGSSATASFSVVLRCGKEECDAPSTTSNLLNELFLVCLSFTAAFSLVLIRSKLQLSYQLGAGKPTLFRGGMKVSSRKSLIEMSRSDRAWFLFRA
jgi:hypothetical protein